MSPNMAAGLACITTVLVAGFIIIWVADGFRAALAVIGGTVALIAAIIGLLAFFAWVFGATLEFS